METRTYEVKEIKVYKLILNDMRSAKIEYCDIAAFSTDYGKLVEWYKSQLAPEPWRDGRWGKTFKEGSPLEWFNPAGSLELNDTHSMWQHGIEDEWISMETFNEVKNSFLYID